MNPPKRVKLSNICLCCKNPVSVELYKDIWNTHSALITASPRQTLTIDHVFQPAETFLCLQHRAHRLNLVQSFRYIWHELLLNPPFCTFSCPNELQCVDTMSRHKKSLSCVHSRISSTFCFHRPWKLFLMSLWRYSRFRLAPFLPSCSPADTPEGVEIWCVWVRRWFLVVVGGLKLVSGFDVLLWRPAETPVFVS